MRTSRLLSLFMCALLLSAAVGCGTPGAPLPPSLGLPNPVDDLTASRKGSRVVLTWSPSQRTTDKQNVKRPGVTRVCRVAGQLSITQCTSVVAEIPPAKIPVPTDQQPRPKLTYEDVLPETVFSANAFATYAVEMLNPSGRSAGLSNQVRVPLAPTLPPATNLEAQVTGDGVTLSWSSLGTPSGSPALRFHYRLLRRLAEKGQFTLIEDVPLSGREARVEDKNFEWEQRYEYKVTPVTDVLDNGQQVAEVEGEDSPVVTVAIHDTFAPAQVNGVQAVFSGAGQRPFIDLSWAPNTESDVAGYDVFRHEEGAQPAKINAGLVKAPAFRDENVQAGKTYFYSVRAVDLRNNAGPVSEDTSETVPVQ
jgi:hypothetical protein